MSRHFEGIGDKWHLLIDNPEQDLPGLATTVAAEGGTRQAWQHTSSAYETVLLAFPPDQPLRGAIVVQGEPEKEMKVKTICPLMEGLPNDMTVEEVYPWKSRVEGAVAARRNEEGEPVWFYTPLLFRDRDDLTPGVRQTILLSGLAMGVRRALLDEMNIIAGPDYEEHAARWLAEHPGESRLDVPQLTVPLSGARILQAGRFSCEYQVRAPITSVQETVFGPQKVYMLHLQFGLNTENPLEIMVYAPERACENYVPHADDEIDAYVWLQGRMLDL